MFPTGLEQPWEGVYFLFPDMEDTFLVIGRILYEQILFVHVVEIKLQPVGQESLIVCEQTENCVILLSKAALRSVP